MTPADLLLTAAVGLLFIGLIAYAFCELRGGDRLLFFVCLLFLVAWVGGAWLARYGPLAVGVAWLLFIAVGFLITIRLVALTASGRDPFRTIREKAGLRAARISRALIGSLFWALAVLLALAILYTILIPE
ncbi:MAG: hypothetical protein M0017_00700 [Desulfobacteraceae bacterium]|nr:hypothetical protein [Desulfobacteraceae bacterium]